VQSRSYATQPQALRVQTWPDLKWVVESHEFGAGTLAHTLILCIYLPQECTVIILDVGSSMSVRPAGYAGAACVQSFSLRQAADSGVGALLELKSPLSIMRGKLSRCSFNKRSNCLASLSGLVCLFSPRSLMIHC